MSNIHGLVTKVSIKADSRGNAPATIELLRIGEWHTLWHGDFEITIADLHEYAANFAKGIGQVEGSGRLPINYAHEEWDKAAGWMTALSVDESRNALVASVEWTPEGERSIKEKEWAYISPEFNPRDSYPYYDPEAPEDENGLPKFVQNVLTGAALTNIPLFKKLKPVMASRLPSKSKDADTTGESDNQPKGQSMKLEDIRDKEVADITAEEKQFLADNKTELTAEEVTKFELGEAPINPTQSGVEASAKTGVVSISADELSKLKASAARADELAAEIDKDKAEAFVGNAIKAGQIKSGDKDRWVAKLTASRGSDRNDLEALINGLPKNEELGQEIGDGGTEAPAAGASTELATKINASIRDAWTKDKRVITASQAREEVLAADSALAARINEEAKEDK